MRLMGFAEGAGQRVLVAMSGGVDSSVAALALQSRGYECAGATMRMFDRSLITGSEDDGTSRPSEATQANDDVSDARAVASKIGIDHMVLDCTDDFENMVIDPFVDSYLGGRTPNPCVECNKYLKFGKFLDRAEELGYGFIATGHYARIWQDQTGRYRLSRGADISKDQTYVLYSLTQQQLAHTLLPMGEMTKDEAREIAAAHGFINASKRDSEDICFIPDGDYAAFLERRIGSKFEPGQILDVQGNVLGEHQGFPRYTIGQRKGLGVACGHPVYVCDKDIQANTITLGTRDQLLSKGCTAIEWNWIQSPVQGRLECQVKTFYRQNPIDAWIEQNADGTMSVNYAQPAPKATPGQSVVAYIGDDVVGGGTIQGWF